MQQPAWPIRYSITPATNCAAMSCSTLLIGANWGSFGDRVCQAAGGRPLPPNRTRRKRDDPRVRRWGLRQKQDEEGGARWHAPPTAAEREQDGGVFPAWPSGSRR